jgi:hypothetical protein
MATLTDAQCGEIRKSLYQSGAGKEELKLLAALPTQQTAKTIHQAAEDATLTAFASFRSAMENALGIPANAASLALAKKWYAAFLLWKIKNL